MREYSDVVIVGAGASGLLCGGMLAASGLSVTIFEKNERPGKKLSATGNGRCNFTNRNLCAGQYYGNFEWMESVLDGYDAEFMIKTFEQLGVYHRERDGYVYPYTNQASTVTEALSDHCRDHGAVIITGCRVSTVQRKKDEKGYTVGTPQGKISCRYVVLASGGKAMAELGGDGSGYKIARSLGHTIHSIFPALTGLVCQGDFWNRTAGTRIQGKFSLLSDHRLTEGECGEIQITKDGVSGIPVFQLCHRAAEDLAEGRLVEGVLDFIPSMSREDLETWIKVHGIRGLVPKKWADFLEKRADPVNCLKDFRFRILSTFGMERAQVTAGGADTNEIDPKTLSSNLVPDLFLAGELIDADGKCGGYNLHFAFTCAIRIAREIIRREK